MLQLSRSCRLRAVLQESTAQPKRGVYLAYIAMAGQMILAGSVSPTEAGVLSWMTLFRASCLRLLFRAQHDAACLMGNRWPSSHLRRPLSKTHVGHRTGGYACHRRRSAAWWNLHDRTAVRGTIRRQSSMTHPFDLASGANEEQCSRAQGQISVLLIEVASSLQQSINYSRAHALICSIHHFV